MRSSHAVDRLGVTFDDDHVVAHAGLVLTATLAARLGVEALADEMVDLGGRPGSGNSGRKVMTLMHSMVAGGDCIDDACCGRDRPARCSAIGCRPRRRWGRSCGRSPSGMSANSTG